MLLGRNELLPRLFEYVYRNAEKIFVAVRTTEKAGDFSEPLPYLLAYSVHAHQLGGVGHDRSLVGADRPAEGRNSVAGALIRHFGHGQTGEVDICRGNVIYY